ncbi:MAG: SGNH/GDSL hydrolase family protein [Clostridiales bacterium]|jgi:lysophospholipase L1-like esterase|nr:SGNH/GDSL hydrolase family protein [Clostridiales bacterium]
MKNILCFGDSLTWGYEANTEKRIAPDKRWTGVLANTLGSEYHIIEDGLNGRTVCNDDCMFGNKNGVKHLEVALECHKPLDLVIVLLGINDLKQRFALTATDVAYGLYHLVTKIQSFPFVVYDCPEILVICPPEVGTGVFDAPFGEMFSFSAIEKSKKLPSVLESLMEMAGCHYMKAGDFCVTCPEDGIHLDIENNRKLGEAVAIKVKEIL